MMVNTARIVATVIQDTIKSGNALTPAQKATIKALCEAEGIPTNGMTLSDMHGAMVQIADKRDADFPAMYDAAARKGICL